MAKRGGKSLDEIVSELEAMRRENSGLRASLSQYQQRLQEIGRPEETSGLSLEQVMSIIDNADDEIVALDPNGMVVYVNKRIEELYGYRRDEVLGKVFMETAAFAHYSPQEIEDLRLGFQAMLQLERPPLAEAMVLRKDGSPIFIEVSSRPLRKDGRVWGAVHVLRDVSERKKAEDRLQELYREERNVRRQIEAEMERRVEFTRAVAHELKTPLTPILASIDMLMSELRDERLLRLARNIGQGASTLHKRIDELHDLARGEVGMLKLRLESLDLRPMLRGVADRMTPLALARGLSLTVHVSPSLPRVRGDVTRLEQVVTNLLDNAIKFTPGGGAIDLAAREKDGNVMVEVKDSGPGMPQRQKAHVFEPRRGSGGDAKGRSDGTGLGLALCKTFVDLHGGRIWAKSRLGEGSTFGFSLPVDTQGAPAEPSEASSALWKVLIIEDDPQIVDSIFLALEREWPQAALLSTRAGGEGIDLVGSERPDVLILDLGLPDMDGLEVLREVRLFSSVPVLVLTVRQEEQDITRALGLGANDYITKPFRMKELLARLKVQLRRQSFSVEDAPVAYGPLRLDPSTYELTYGSREISLTVIEGHILKQLMLNAGHVVTYDRLAEAVWGEDYPGAVVALRTHVRQLRQKLQLSPGDPKLILTKAGIGYSLAKLV